MGISSTRAPTDIPGLYDVPIGSSGAARYGEMVSHGVREAEKLLTRYLLIDKIKPPWLPFSSQIADISGDVAPFEAWNSLPDSETI